MAAARQGVRPVFEELGGIADHFGDRGGAARSDARGSRRHRLHSGMPNPSKSEGKTSMSAR